MHFQGIAGIPFLASSLQPQAAVYPWPTNHRSRVPKENNCIHYRTYTDVCHYTTQYNSVHTPLADYFKYMWKYSIQEVSILHRVFENLWVLVAGPNP